MNRSIQIAAALIISVGLAPTDTFARGFGGFGGGGFHAGGFGGGGFHAGGIGGGGIGGGFHAGGFSAGGMHAGGFGGAAGGLGGDSFHAGGFGAGGVGAGGLGGGGLGAGGFGGDGARAGGFGGDGLGSRGFGNGGLGAGGFSGAPNRSQLNSFLGLPTDGGMHAAGGAVGGWGAAAGPEGAAAARGGATAHEYQGPMGTTVYHGAAGVQGAAVGPGGAAAGGRFASGTAIEGPGGNTVTHTSSGGRGVAAGPGGVEAGREFSSRSTVEGAGGASATRGVSGAQGIAAGPGGVAAGGTVSAGRAIRGPAGNVYAGGATASRGFAAGGYGAHYGTATYYHAQGIAGRRWFAANPVFTAGWVAGNRWAWRPAAYAPAAWNAAIWRAAAWPAVGTWFGWTDVTPYAYDYGTNIVYQDGTVYYGSQPEGTAAEYYDQAADLANTGADASDDENSQWLPLGVFALMRPDTKTPDVVMQLAVDKNGIVRGNCYIEATKKTVAAHGAVDKKTQRVAWRIGENENLVVETGLYSLTQDQSTALVHSGPQQTTQYLMVRMKQPSQDGTQSSTGNG
ncbi:MAG: protocadherin [Planctomycetes bacterium]|nr:protocadherin [Planctomycetota bacterium]